MRLLKSDKDIIYVDHVTETSLSGLNCKEVVILMLKKYVLLK